MKLDHIYLSVENMDRAISFWEEVLNQKISYKNKDRWANFQDNGVYLGLYRPGYDGESMKMGNNVTMVLRSANLEADHQKIKTLTSEVSELQQAGPNYRLFFFKDSEGNSVEVAEYKSPTPNM